MEIISEMKHLDSKNDTVGWLIPCFKVANSGNKSKHVCQEGEGMFLNKSL